MGQTLLIWAVFLGTAPGKPCVDRAAGCADLELVMRRPKITAAMSTFAAYAQLGDIGRATKCREDDPRPESTGFPEELAVTVPIGKSEVHLYVDRQTCGNRLLRAILHPIDTFSDDGSGIPPKETPRSLSEKRAQAKEFAISVRKTLLLTDQQLSTEPEVTEYAYGLVVGWRRMLGQYPVEHDGLAISVVRTEKGWRLNTFEYYRPYSDALRVEQFKAKHKLTEAEALVFARKAAAVQGAYWGPRLDDVKVVPPKKPTFSTLVIIGISIDAKESLRAKQGFDCANTTKTDYTKPVLAYYFGFNMITEAGNEVDYSFGVWISAEDGSVIGCKEA